MDSKLDSKLIADLLAGLKQGPLATLLIQPDPDLNRASPFDAINAETKASALEACKEQVQSDSVLSRAIGSMEGMAIADSIGHNYEFVAVRDQVGDSSSYFEYPSSVRGGIAHEPYNKFHLAPGQWTDDTSMGLCMADSILLHGRYDGIRTRIWFFNWWFNGLDNAFRLDPNRSNSVGLGGNISNSLTEIQSCHERKIPIPPRFASDQEDAGNGSLMRLVPVVLRYHHDIKLAREQAYESSLSTHPGKMAAEACAFMAHIIVRALHRPEDSKQTAAEFLDEVRTEYLELLGDISGQPARQAIRRVVVGEQEGDTSTERCWNWRNPDLGLERTLANRGRSYNGYPVSAGYFGAFSLDGLAMALHCFYHTNDFNAAVVKIVNLRGDADTTGSICAQMAGAFYGVQAIDQVWRDQLHQWDQGEISLRALLLCRAHEVEEAPPVPVEEIEEAMSRYPGPLPARGGFGGGGAGGAGGGCQVS